MKNSDQGIAIISYLQWNLKKGAVDLPCYSNLTVQDDFNKRIMELCKKKESSDEDAEIIKIFALQNNWQYHGSICSVIEQRFIYHCNRQVCMFCD